MTKLCFDAGHYEGYNPSSVFPSYKEGDKMFILVNHIKDYLESNYNVEIKLTRNNNKKDVSVYDRGTMAKGCNAFYSFHTNACDDSDVTRVVIYRSFGNTTLDDYCKSLGDAIKDCMGVKQKTQVTERGTIATNDEYYGVLRGSKNVGVKERYIIEHSFHTNKEMAMWLYSNDNLKKLSIVEGEEIAKHHNLKKKIPSYVKVIKRCNVRTKPTTKIEPFTKAHIGDVFTVVGKEGSFYKLKSGMYITSSSEYVEEYKKG